MQPLIISLRGHIRCSFDNSGLYDFITCMSQQFDVRIYIHTWLKRECTASWRPLIDKYKDVDIKEQDIRDYLGTHCDKIKKICIEDEDESDLHGNIEGKLTPICMMPKRSWKFFLYGVWKSIDIIDDKNDKNAYMVNVRFDMFQKRLVFAWGQIGKENRPNNNQYIAQSIAEIICKRMKNPPRVESVSPSRNGYDNIFMGTVEAMTLLTSVLHKHLDTILEDCDKVKMQEIIVYDVLYNIKKNYNHYDHLFNNDGC